MLTRRTFLTPVPFSSPSPLAGKGSRQSQRGFSLFVAVIFLIVLSLLAIISVRGVITSNRMAGNTQDWNLAFQAAEAGLRDGEADVVGVNAEGNAVANPRSTGPVAGPAAFTSDCTAGLCLPATTAGSPPVWSLNSTALANDTGWSQGANVSSPSVLYGSITGADKLPNPDATTAADTLAAQPHYIIEDLGPVGLNSVVSGSYSSGNAASRAYRVTAVGFGRITNLKGAPATRVVLQSVITH